MCAIIDADVAHQVFGANRPEAGAEFFKWLNTGRGRLAVGGRLRAELRRTSAENWMQQAILAGRITQIDDVEVEARTVELETQRLCKSNDPHVLALAQVSGARLLYSNDGNLARDFKSKRLVEFPRGKVYSTDRGEGRFQRSHKGLLTRTDLCRNGM